MPRKRKPKSSPPRPSADRRKRFVEEYLLDLNSTQAAIRAGYSKKTAAQQASRMLRSVNVSRMVAERQKEIASKLEVTPERVIAEYARIGFSDMRRLMKWGPFGVELLESEGLSEDDSRAVAEVSQTVSATGGSIKLKAHDKKGALDSLAKHLGMFMGRDGDPVGGDDVYILRKVSVGEPPPGAKDDELPSAPDVKKLPE